MCFSGENNRNVTGRCSHAASTTPGPADPARSPRPAADAAGAARAPAAAGSAADAALTDRQIC